jgi:DHA2 family multidrug resistance protein-like MFS transporter
MRIIHPDGLPTPRRYWAYATVALAVILAVMDGSVANVALPTIAGDFGTTPSLSIWIVNAYQLAVVGSLLPLASLGEIHGYRRIYLGGLIVFTLASLACALSPTLGVLAAARVAQGFGAAGVMSVNIALVRYIFPRARLSRAIGLNALFAAVAATIGPTFASVVLGIATWPWLFAVNVPLGVAALAIGWRSLPHSDRATHRFDIGSAVLTAAAFAMLITGIDSVAQNQPWWVILAQGLLCLGAGGWAAARQLERPAPLLPIDLLRIPIFALSVLTSVCSFAAQMIAFVALPFHMQALLGVSPSMIGFLVMPWPLAVGAFAPISGWLVDRYPAALLGGLGLAMMAAGLVLVAQVPPHPAFADMAWRMVLCGSGFGLFQTPNNRTLIAAAPRARSGGASGMLGTARLTGQSVGAALVAVLLAHFPHTGTYLSLYMAAGFSAAAAVVSTLRVGTRAQPRLA